LSSGPDLLEVLKGEIIFKCADFMLGILSKEAGKDVLRANIIGRIGCNDGTRTYIVPVQYVFDGKDIYSHGAERMKIHIMRKNPAVCFEADQIHHLNNWKSVIAWGKYEELKSEYARYNAISLFSKHFLQLKISKTAMLPQIGIDNEFPFSAAHIRPVIFRIIIEDLTGRFENTLPANLGN